VSLRARLLATFLLLALLPTIVFTSIMLEQIDRAHRVLVPSPGVEQALESALVVSKTSLRRAEATLHGLAQDWAPLLEPGPPGAAIVASIAATLRSSGADFAQLYLRKGSAWTLVREIDPPGVLTPGRLDLAGELDEALANDGTLHSPKGALGAVARVGRDRAVVAGDRVPPDFFEHIANVGEGANIYRRIAAGYGAVSRAVLLVWAIGLSLLLAIAAVWLSAQLSHQLTRPVAAIAGAMERVAAGDLRVQVEPAGAREIKQVGARFNEMVSRLDEARGQLARAEREAAWRGIARRVAHEIKNALTPMRLSLHGLQKRIDAMPAAEQPAAREGLRALIDEVDALSRLAEQFSDFARLPEPRRVPIELGGLVRSTTALYPRPGFELRVKAPEEPVWILGDALLIGRALHNLLINAFEAMPGGGQIEVSLRQEPGYADMDVRDRGAGMTADVLARAFEPDFSTKGRGSGLGLSMARDIAAQHGGQLTLESTLGQGTQARLRLPLTSAAMARGIDRT
jgi:nitrogen fixation/metabolism regulation signal transduction histidine kinase